MRIIKILYFFCFLGVSLIWSSSISAKEKSGQGSNHSIGNRELQRVAKRVVRSLILADWNALRKDAAPVVTMAQYTRVYSSEWSPKQLQHLTASDFELTKINTPGVGSQINTVVTLTISTKRNIRSFERKLFSTFCRHVRNTLANRPDWLQIGEYITSKEELSLIGPAMQCKMLSNEEWRVEFQYLGHRWVVSRLIMVAH